MRGYSDRINHALAFAAKHHDTQVRKGLRMPYVTHAANVAVILTHYGCDETVVVAGVLHDVIEDSVRDGFTPDDLSDRIGAKFGEDVLHTVLTVTRRRLDDDGVEMSKEDVREDYLARLGTASEAAHWVCAAHNLHNAGTILADLRRTIEPTTVWNRGGAGRDGTLQWYRAVHDRLTAVGYRAPIMAELGDMVAQLDAAPVGDASALI
ncbi:MAG: HD domain-containing protein [Gemmatimonadaceae bacterium]|nr:HD domain-containing protein [Gemmatimonadaceae bacterium]